MKVVVLAVIFLLSCSANGQVLKEPLKRSLINQYLAERCNNAKSVADSTSIVLDDIKEIFSGCFDSVKLYLVTFRNRQWSIGEPKFYGAVYAVDTLKWRVVLFNNGNAFCSFVNKGMGIANIDRAYLYIFMYLKLANNRNFVVQEPWDYTFEIGHSSKFAFDSVTHEVFFGFPHTFEACFCFAHGEGHSKDSTHDQSGFFNVRFNRVMSTTTRISIYSIILKCGAEQTEEFNMDFDFSANSRLVGVKIDTVR